MNHIPTTATAVQKLRRLAKDRRKTTRESLAAAQDAVARDHGYMHWKHVTVCQTHTAATKPTSVPLPESIREFLREHQAEQPKIVATQLAIREGLVFAMDVKDAMSVQPANYAGISECEDARAFLAGDIWAAILRRELEDGLDVTTNDEESLQDFLDDTSNYSFFRYTGEPTPRSVDEAFGTVFKGFFFPPTHVWLAGKFTDIADLAEIRSGFGGPVVMTRAPAKGGSPVMRVYAPAQVDKQVEAMLKAPRPNERRPLVARLDVRRIEPGHYEYRASYSDQELFYNAGFTSIAEALKAASDVEGDIIGFEVGYAGFVVGTYAVQELQVDAETIAQRAVETAASFREF